MILKSVVTAQSESALQPRQSSMKVPFSGWTVTVLAIALVLAFPIVAVVIGASGAIWESSTEGVWGHLVETVLATYVINSLGLMAGVGVGVTVLGVSTAWLVTMTRFPGRQIYEWALLLPLAAPAYLLAYTYTDFLEYFGPVQRTLRLLFGWQSASDYWFPDVRSIGGAIILFSLVLYPYVYMLARVAFLEQSLCMIEASRILGCGAWRSFFTVAIPLARPAIAAGTALALMETLNDFGTVQYFGVPTFTTGIYRTWFGMGEQVAATQLASLLLLFVAVLILLERLSRRQARYYQLAGRQQARSSYVLTGSRAIAAAIACAVPVILGLILPGILLFNMVLFNLSASLDSAFLQLAGHSLTLSVATAVVAIITATVLAYGARIQAGAPVKLGVQVSSLGYAIPGAVIAVGIMIPLARLDEVISVGLERLLGVSTGLLLSGTVFALIFAYLVRFLAVALNTVDSGLAKVRPTLDEASRSLGNSPSGTLSRVHAPLIRGSLLTAAVLVFVDVMKELPATLAIRPFNFDTLAIRVYQYASDERLVEAAAPALAILVVGLLPILILSRQITQERRSP